MIDENKLYQMYVIQNMKQSDIAKEFNVNRVTVTRRIKKLGFTRLYKDKKWLKQMVEEGKTIPEMMELAHCSNETIRTHLRKYNLDVQDEVRYKHFRKYHADYNFFEIIDTEEKAYWLGFILADGAILTDSNKEKTLRLQILLQASDAPHIQKFLDSIQSNHPIKIDEVTLNGKKHKQARVRINGYKLCQDLMKHNVYSNKSTKEQVAENLPDHLISHYLRGYFDGDGTFSHWYTAKNNSTSGFTVIGSKEIVSFFKQHLTPFLSGDPTIKKKDSLHYLAVGGSLQVERIMDYLYKDATIYLERKYNNYHQWKASRS